MQNKTHITIGAGLVTVALLASALPVFAEGPGRPPMIGGGALPPMHGATTNQLHRPEGPAGAQGVFGSVTAVNGNTITVQPRLPMGATTTVFSIDATNAKVTKNGTTSAASAVAVGDVLMAQGTLNGTSMVATVIRDGMPAGVGMPEQNQNPGSMMGKGGEEKKGGHASSTPPFVGNGQPVIGGTVSAVNGSSLTVSNKGGVTYTVDATNAKVLHGNTAVALTAVQTGDAVIVQGVVNGMAVTASTIVDQVAPGAEAGNMPKGTPGKKGFFTEIGGFFARLFGF